MMGKKTKRPLRLAVVYAVLLALTFLCLFFFYILMVNATKSHIQLQQKFSFWPGTHLAENFTNVINDANVPILYGILNSMIVSTCCAALSTYFSVMTAYGLFVYNSRLHDALFTFIMMILVMPTQVCTLGFLRIIGGMGLSDTLLALILPSIASPAVFYFMYSYMRSTLPISLVDAAKVDGAGDLRIFNRIVLPLMKPAMAVQAIFSFVSSWNNYFVPALVISTRHKQTLPVMIATIRGADFMNFDMGKVYMMIAIAIVPIIFVYLMLSRHIIDGIIVGSVKE